MRTAQSWVLPKELTSPGRARRHLTTACPDLPTGVLDVALLLTSELVTNAVKYGGPRIVLTLRDEPEVLRIEVHDDGPTAPRASEAATEAVGGRGLALVGSLASDWGTRTEPDTPGKTVWFALRKP